MKDKSRICDPEHALWWVDKSWESLCDIIALCSWNINIYVNGLYDSIKKQTDLQVLSMITEQYRATSGGGDSLTEDLGSFWWTTGT